jgi:hypothetical protein
MTDNDEIQRAWANIERITDAEQQRRFEEQLRGPADELEAACAHIDELNYLKASRPPLKTAAPPPKPKQQPNGITRAELRTGLEAVVSIVGDECGRAEAKLRADMKRELDALREEIAQLRQQRADPEFLPNWQMSDDVRH